MVIPHANRKCNMLFVAVFSILNILISVFAGKVYADTNLQFSVEVPPTLEVTLLDAYGESLNGSTSMSVAPTLSSTSFNEKDVVINVGTNNEWGYSLFMSVPNPNLTTIDGDKITTLPEKTEGYICTVVTANDCDFVVNSWGYRIKQDTANRPATNYLAVPRETSLTKTSTLSSSDKTYLAFGTKVDAMQTPGIYTTTIVFTVVANPDTNLTMQEVDTASLASLMPEVGDTAFIKDARDNDKYTITKIDKDLYWMTDNLRIVDEVSAEMSNFYGDKFDISANSLSLEWDQSGSYLEPRSAYDEEHPEYGAYYNYCAASAGTICSDQLRKDATEDICPLGWRLPTYDEIDKIANANSIDRNAPFAGDYTNGQLLLTGTANFWWSATAYSQSSQYYLYSNEDSWSIIPTTKANGHSVRCVYDTTTIDDIDYLQDFYGLSKAGKESVLKSMQEGFTYTKTDKRDGQEYDIAKLKDGNIWLLDDLRIGAKELTEELSVDNTNMSPDVEFVLPASSTDKFNASDGYEIAAINTDSADSVIPFPSDYVGEYKERGSVYYNYCAASAGTYCYDVNGDPEEKNAEYDVCPAGWSLPSGGPESNYQNLYDVYDNDHSSFISALHLTLSGYFSNDFARMGSGYYWSSTYGDRSNYMYYLFIDDGSTVAPADRIFRFDGHALRCIVK